MNKRSDGFHSIESVFWPIAWTDALELHRKETPGLELTVTGLKVPGTKEANLVFKAYNALMEDEFLQWQPGNNAFRAFTQLPDEDIPKELDCHDHDETIGQKKPLIVITDSTMKFSHKKKLVNPGYQDAEASLNRRIMTHCPYSYSEVISRVASGAQAKEC